MPLARDLHRISTNVRFLTGSLRLLEWFASRPSTDFPFRLLLGFHKLYSRVLLLAARSSLTRRHEF